MQGCDRDVGGDRGLAIAGRERGDGIGVAQRHGQMVEAVRVTPQLLGRHLQHHRIKGQAHRGHGDAILLAEIGERLDVGVDGVVVALLLTVPTAFTSRRCRAFAPHTASQGWQRGRPVVGRTGQNGIENGTWSAQGRCRRLYSAEPQLHCRTPPLTMTSTAAVAQSARR